MASDLKTLRVRIKSVKSTQKITRAMKMVAASKLRRAQERAEAARPYTEKMERVIATLASSINDVANAPALLAGSGKSKKHLFVLLSSDRGLCGGFNSTLVRAVRIELEKLVSSGKEVKIIVVGKKGYDQLKTGYASNIHERISDLGDKGQISYEDAQGVGKKVLAMFDAGEFDVCKVVYNRFESAISQVATMQQLIPLDVDALKEKFGKLDAGDGAVYDYEPGEEEVLSELLPKNINVQIYRAMLENAASEQGARMTAMDNATRNAGDMIDALTLQYNRSRQAAITTELTEIISGAEAL